MRIAVLIISSYFGCSAGVLVIFPLALSDILVISGSLPSCELCDSFEKFEARRWHSKFLLVNADRIENKYGKVSKGRCYSVFVSCKYLTINRLVRSFIRVFHCNTLLKPFSRDRGKLFANNTIKLATFLRCFVCWLVYSFIC